MELSAREPHVRASTRTLLLAVLGIVAAALVTSVSALHTQNDPRLFARVAQGGTAVAATVAVLALACAARIKPAADRGVWLLAGSALVFTTVGSALRSGAMFGAVGAYRPGIAEVAYGAGLSLLASALVAWPIVHRRSLPLGTTLIEALVSAAVVSAGFWFIVGRGMVDTAFMSGIVSPLRMQEMLALLMLLAASALFSLVAIAHARESVPVLPWLMVVAAMAAFVAVDLMWLARMADTGWRPGSFFDFVHMAGHVLVSIGASLALDAGAQERRQAQESAGAA